MRLFLGDKSVVITKDFICYFEEADVCVRVVLSSGADSVVLRCGLGELVSLRVYGTRESEGL